MKVPRDVACSWQVRWIFQSPNLASCTRWLDILRNEGCCMADFAQRFELTQAPRAATRGLGNAGVLQGRALWAKK